jgi:hypothetical protein
MVVPKRRSWMCCPKGLGLGVAAETLASQNCRTRFCFQYTGVGISKLWLQRFFSNFPSVGGTARCFTSSIDEHRLPSGGPENPVGQNHRNSQLDSAIIFTDGAARGNPG